MHHIKNKRPEKPLQCHFLFIRGVCGYTQHLVINFNIDCRMQLAVKTAFRPFDIDGIAIKGDLNLIWKLNRLFSYSGP